MRGLLSVICFTTLCFFVATAVAADKVVVIPLGKSVSIDGPIAWQGPWQTGVDYQVADGVQFEGNSYICIGTHTSSAPTSPPLDTYWDLMAARGNIGPQGERGFTGSQGPQGDTGAQGDRGVIGQTGQQGPQGDTGAQGDRGAIGQTGPRGLMGPPGPQGPGYNTNRVYNSISEGFDPYERKQVSVECPAGVITGGGCYRTGLLTYVTQTGSNIHSSEEKITCEWINHTEYYLISTNLQVWGACMVRAD